MKKGRLLSLVMAIVLIIGLLPLNAFAASSTGTGISVTTNPNHFIRRVNHHGSEYTYKPPLVDGKWGYCVDFGFSYNSEDAAFRNSYSWTHATGAEAEDLFERALLISGMDNFSPEVVENAKWLMSYINQHYTLADNELGAWLMTVQTYLWDNMERKAYGDTADAGSNVDDGGYANVSRYERYKELYTWLLTLKAEEDQDLQRQADDYAAEGRDAYIAADPSSQWAVYATSSISGRQGFFNYNEQRRVYVGDRPDDPERPEDPPSGEDGGVTITKRDGRTNDPLADATYRIEGIDQAYDNSVTTGRNGVAVVEELFSGSYRIFEENPPEGYLPSDEVQTIHYDGERSINVTFFNDPLATIDLYKQDANTGADCSAVFDVFKDTEHIDTIRVDGHYTLSGLFEGTYTFVEVACDGNYILDPTPHSIHVDPAGSATVSYDLIITNQRKPGLEILKYDRVSNRPLPNIPFAVYKDAELCGEFTTDEEGRIYLDNLLPGTYLAVEIGSDDEHLVNSTPQQIEIKAGDTVKTLVFFNDLKPGIHLVKVDRADLSKPIANAKFKFEAVDGSWGPVELTTLAGGTIDLSKLPEGACVVTELACPGYVIDNAQRIIQLKPNETAQFVFTNSKLPSLLLKKESSDSSPLPGVSYRLAKIEDGSFYLDRTTDSKGEILWEGLEPGVYSLREISTVSDHILDPREYHIELFPGKVSTKVVQNQRRPNLIVYKNDADSEEPVPDTVFIVKAVDGHSVDEIRTDESGKAELKNLLPGVYEITEKSVPSPWLNDSEPQLVTLYPNRDHTVYFRNHKRPVIEIIKENAVTFDPLAHVPFRVWYASNNTSTGEFNDLGVFYTDENGRIELNGPEMGTLGLRDGWFRVQELEPLKGFAKADPDTQEAFVPAGQGHTFRFRNQPLSAICGWKYDSVHPNVAIEGAVFQIRYLSGNTSGTGGTVIGTYRTSANGSFTATGLAKGTYIIEELSSDGSHVIDTPPQTVYLSGEEQEVVQIYFGNSPKGALLVKKLSASDNSPLSDVEFFVTDSSGAVIGDANGKFATDSSGCFLIENIDPNTTLVVKEVRAKEGYLLDDTPQTAVVKAGQTVTLEFRNKPLGGLVIHKLDGVTKKPLAGVPFKITYADGKVVDAQGGKLSSNGLYYTNAEGQIVLSGITGTIIVTEVESIPGYTIDPETRSQTVVVNPDDTQSLYFYNMPTQTLTIQKYVDGSTDPIQGVTFLITDSSGQMLGPDNGEFITDRNGRIVLTDLIPGTTVIAKEVQTVEGYVLDSTPQSILIRQGAAQTLTFYNKAEGGLELIKVSAAKKTQRIPNTTFEIRRMDGALVNTVTTDKNGRVYAALDAGDYYCVEAEAAKGFKLDNTPHYFTIQDGKTTALTVTNIPFSGILLHKTDSTTGEGIYGVKFLLYDDSRNPLGEYTTDDEGYIYIDDLPNEGSARYYLRELEAAPGYKLDKEYKTVYVKPGKTTEVEWENTPVTGQIQIYKYAAEYNEVTGTPAGTPLKGAVYEIVNTRSGKVVDYITTDARGVAASKPLPLGRYQIREVTAPAYWQLDSTVFDETLEFAGQIIKLSAFDKPSSLGVAITKRGNAEVLSGSQMRYDFTVANTSNVPLENFYWHDRIPTDAARATVLTTGTYSARLNYRILYKTNYSGTYQVLASNLLTSSSYSFSVNAIPMQAGEVVTDIYFDFGKVPVGFQSTSNPTLTVQVLGTTANGYQVVNRADAGGKYQGTWQTAQASWVTIVRRLTQIPTLPKTGY